MPIKRILSLATVALTFISHVASAQTNEAIATSSEPPKEWVDKDTGHRVVRLSREPGSESFYFNVNAFTPDGRTMVFTTTNGICTLDLGSRKIERLVDGQHLRMIQVGRKTGQVYYSQYTNIFAADPSTKAVRKICTLPRGTRLASVNCDETLLGGTVTTLTEEQWAAEDEREKSFVSNSDSEHKSRARNIQERFDQHYQMELLFYNIQTGEMKKFVKCNDWLNHLLFSPTDPNLLMFCHEGPWHQLDRIWTIRSDGSDLNLIHQRTIAMEIAGHEFWGADGKTIWYDLQTPRGEDFWVGGYNVTTGERTRYHLQRNEWSVHFNVSPDGKLFSGDGGGPGMVAHAPDGQWIYLFHPEMLPDLSGTNMLTQNLIKPGVFHSEKLVNMKDHDYALEPNAMFTPDMKWLVFRSNMFGTNQVHVFAVQLEKAKTETAKN